ncbi:MAG: isocitrate lyase/phosphoenolpyruvate mutase family protein [Ferruginibacter sp.]
MNHFETFLQLHNTGRPLLIGNCWDVGSAKLLEENGFKAIATSSAAIANSLGYEDGENMPFDLLFETVKRIKQHISVPFSVDMERGYGNNIPRIIQNIERLHDIGVVGINIEDSTNDRKLQSIDMFEKTILSIAHHLSQKNISIFINARTDAFLLQLPDALAETRKRIEVYEAAGANGIFVPFITDENDIQAITNTTGLPVNVLSVPRLPGIGILSSLGVRRVSLGSFLYRSINKEIVNKLHAIKQTQSFAGLF